MPFIVSPLWKRRLLRGFVWASGLVMVATGGFFGYMKAVEKNWIHYNKWDRRENGSLQVGQQAPDMELPTLDGGAVRLAALWRERPVVLVFGSCT